MFTPAQETHHPSKRGPPSKPSFWVLFKRLVNYINLVFYFGNIIIPYPPHKFSSIHCLVWETISVWDYANKALRYVW